MPFSTGLAAAVAVLGVLGSTAALAAPASAQAGNAVRSQEWWLADLHVTQAWQKSEGAGITVAVLDTGVAASHPDLVGQVITGPDYTGSGRTPDGPFWGVEGTAVAGLIAGHGHGSGGGSGIVGIAPAARILSVRVTLEFNDPLSSDQAVSRRLPQAIADGISYAVDHRAQVIDLPLDPGTLGLTAQGDPAAAGGSPAERAAVAYALSKGVVLVAPAGDNGEGLDSVNYPAAYPGVIAVGAVGRDGLLAPFSSRQPYVSLTAPGAGLVAAAPSSGYQTISSTSTAGAIVAGVAALVLSRFPQLTVAQVTRALTESTAPPITGASGTGLPPLPARSAAGAGYGTVDAARAVEMAALITSASQPVTRPPRPRRPARQPVASARRPSASTLAGSVLKYAVVGAGVLIVLLAVMLLLMRSRRRPARGAAAAGTGSHGRARAPGLHEQRRPERGPVLPATDAQANGLRSGPARPGPATAEARPSPGGWPGGGIGEITRPPAALPRPAATSARSAIRGYRPGRGTPAQAGPAGPPWAPAPEPERLTGPIPSVPDGSPQPLPGPGIPAPGNRAPQPVAASDSAPPGYEAAAAPAGFGPAPGLPDFDFGPAAGPPVVSAIPPGLPDFDVPPAAAADPGYAGLTETTAPFPAAIDLGPPLGPEFPVRQSLGFAAAPVPTPLAGDPTDADRATAAAADPSYIWDLAATDVFPAAIDPPAQPAETPDEPPPPEGVSGGGGG
jgi:Subtilase family